MNDNTEMTDKQKIETLNERLVEMEQKFYKIHSLADALISHETRCENGEKDDNTVSNVSENIAEVIREIANDGADVVAARPIIL